MPCPTCRRWIHAGLIACAVCGAVLDLTGPDAPHARYDAEPIARVTVVGSSSSTIGQLGGTAYGQSFGWSGLDIA